MSPTARTLKYLRNNGWTADVCERWVVRVRKDLHGFADIHAFNDETDLLVQCTSGSNLAARVKKVKANEAAMRWVRGRDGREIWCIGWRQVVKRNKNGRKSKVKRWQPRIEIIRATTMKVQEI